MSASQSIDPDTIPWIDWGLAAAVGRSLVPPGPKTTRVEADRLVAELRDCARRAPSLVAAAAHLDAVGDAPELVVDRQGIVIANVQAAQSMLVQAVGEPAHPGLAQRLSGRATARGIGTVLAVLGTRVLGQYDALSSQPRLLLVAPNILQVERELRLVPSDFRMWVCLHEQTHRVQFAHAPWLVDHLVGLCREAVEAEEHSLLEGLGESWTQLRSQPDGQALTSLAGLAALAGPQLAAILGRVTAVMSLLEGHADVMMDRAGPAVIGTLPHIRASFDARRAKGGWTALVGKLIGLDAKLAQYRDGANFCRAVIARAGVDGLNTAFLGPDRLPTLDELLHPEDWLTRQGLPGLASSAR